MLKKTVARHFKFQDAARHMKRRFLSYAQNAPEIQYLLETALAEATGGKSSKAPAAKSAIQAAPPKQETAKAPKKEEPSEGQANVAAPVQVVNAEAIPDAPVDAKDIVVVIIARKLRKSFDELATQQTIKALVNGIVLLSLPSLRPPSSPIRGVILMICRSINNGK